MRRLSWLLIAIFVFAVALAGCSSTPKPETVDDRYGVYYQIFVKSFYDSTGDGNGDINGITAKLDYLEYLGITGIWLTPVHPSPSYHKYDVTDYYKIDSQFGDVEDFRQLVAEAGDRGIKVILDLVVNHTSDEHPWFLDASNDPNSQYRDYYIWADEETNLWEPGEWAQRLWHEVESGHYYGTFWSGMPDLNMDNHKVRQELVDIAQFWLEVGVAGFRLDAIKHIYPGSLEKNQEWWQYFRAQLEETKPDVYLVGEVWDNYHVVAPYYQSLDSNFNFNLSDRIIDAVNTGRNQDLTATLERHYDAFGLHSHDFIDAVFLTNHDQTRVYNRLGYSNEKSKLIASILLTLPGNPFIYYGEELGMRGRKPDENIREPMLWYSDPKTEGQTSWQPLRDNLGGVTTPVEEQLKDVDSLLNHYRNMILVRRNLPALLYGGLESYPIDDRKILAFIRTHSGGDALVVHNLGQEVVTITLSGWNTLFHSTDLGASFDKGKLILPAGSTGILTR